MRLPWSFDFNAVLMRKQLNNSPAPLEPIPSLIVPDADDCLLLPLSKLGRVSCSAAVSLYIILLIA